MAKQGVDLIGVWRSSFEYGDNQRSEHKINLQQHLLRVEGSNQSDETGSELSIELWIKSDQTQGGVKHTLEGFWKEKTSRQGKYGGQSFHGVGSLLLNEKATLAGGHWSGHNSSFTKDKSGRWTLEKLDENTKI